MLRKTLAVVLLASAVAVVWAQRRRAAGAPAPADSSVIDARQLMLSTGWPVHATPREECRLLAPDSRGGLWTIGVASNGEPRRNSTRQYISLGRYEGVHWNSVARVSADGYVFSPAAATADSRGGLWITWAEFNDAERNWDIQARYWDGAKLGATQRLSSNRGASSGPHVRPAIAMLPGGLPLVVWESGANGTFQLQSSQLENGRWSAPEALTSSSEPNFRPALATGGDGTLWLAWDRFVDGDYDVYLRSRTPNQKWSSEAALFATRADEQRPSIRVDTHNVAWILAGNRLAGVKDGRRYQLGVEVPPNTEEFQIDPSGRFWFFQQVRPFNPGTAYVPGAGGAISMSWFDGGSLSAPRTVEMGLGYRAPIFLAGGALWNSTDTVIYRLAAGLPPPQPARIAPQPAPGPLAEQKNPALPHPHPLHETIQIDGQTYTLYWGEMHTHLREHPTDRTIETWIDRFYLKAGRTGVLDFASASDHDWEFMTASKFLNEQAYSSVLSRSEDFLAFIGYEWSGDNYGRRRYGDRTIVFLRDYSPIFRITDEESNTPQKLHARLTEIGAIDWPHHVGAPFAVMDWTTHSATVEPVVEMVSGHGVYETYDRARAVPVWLTKEPVGKSSIQDGLAAGHRFGLVGSSDSHNGLTGYSNGMLGVYAKSLTRDAILDAYRHRRTFAVRGGEPIALDFRVDGKFMGGELKSGGAPLLSVHAKAPSPLEKIEIVRNNEYIYTHAPSAGSLETRFEYRDKDAPAVGAYYYVRVWVKGDHYAWSSPIWVD